MAAGVVKTVYASDFVMAGLVEAKARTVLMYATVIAVPVAPVTNCKLALSPAAIVSEFELSSKKPVAVEPMESDCAPFAPLILVLRVEEAETVFVRTLMPRPFSRPGNGISTDVMSSLLDAARFPDKDSYFVVFAEYDVPVRFPPIKQCSSPVVASCVKKMPEGEKNCVPVPVVIKALTKSLAANESVLTES